MTWRRAAALALALATTIIATPAVAAADRQVILVVTSGVSYEDALRDPLLGALAGHGGIGLMTTSGGAERGSRAAVSLGAGRSADGAPSGPVPFEEAGEGLLVDAAPYREAAGEAETGLMGTVLAAAERKVAYVDLGGASGDPAMLAAMDLRGGIPVASLNRFPVLADLPPEFLGSSAEGPVEQAELVVSPEPGIVRFALEHTTAGEVLVVVVAASASDAMRARGDTVTPLVLARGSPDELLEDAPAPAGLTSETTRREGLVSNVDVAPTILEFLGVDVPEEMVGSPIMAAGEPPTDLHRRYLEWREVVTPVGLLVLGLALASLILGLALIFGPRQPSRRAFGVLAVGGLGSVALLVTLVPASLLPTFSWPAVLGALAVGAGALVAIGLRVGRGSATGPVVVVTVFGLALVAADVALGWRSGATPLLGGSALDGERFFGLGNPYAGIVLSGAILGAARLRPRAGVVLIAAAALFAALPFLGADVGGAITLAVASALWYGINRWGRLGWQSWTVAAGAAAVAVAALVLTHGLLPPGETHVSRAVTDADGVFSALEVFWRRLLLNVEETSAAPAAWLAVLGLPVWLAVAIRPPARLRPVLEANPAWRRAVIVLAVGGILGFLLNDTFGMAAIAFVFLSAAVVYPALAGRWRGEALREPLPGTARAGG